jgi:SynChlorMet cassette radical SAM/SPASM protein ScmE
VDDLDNIARLLLEEVGLPNFDTNSASHFGLCRFNAEQVQLTAEERTRAMESLLRLTKHYNGRINAQAGPLAEASMWLNMEQARSRELSSMPNCGYLTSCAGPMSKLAVRADGTFLICAQIPGIELGRMNDDRLSEVWTNNRILNEFRRRVRIQLSSIPFCKDCSYIDYCRGGCPATAYSACEDTFQPSPFECLRDFIKQGGELPKTEDFRSGVDVGET